MKKYITAGLLTLATPLIASAQLTNTQGFITKIGDIINQLIGVVAALALFAFMWGLAKFIFKAGDEKAQTEGKNIMVWGILALFVMFSVWGIVRFLQTELGVTDNSGGQAPRSQTPPALPYTPPGGLKSI